MLVARPRHESKEIAQYSPAENVFVLSPAAEEGASSRPKALRMKGSRQSVGKSRGGCLTCKKRRVKCDEAKPHCKKCKSFGRTCDGYQPWRVVMQRGKNGFPLGEEWTEVSQDGHQNNSKARPRSLLAQVPGPRSKRFETEHESRFFGLYLNEIARSIAGPFKTTTWSRLIPQACEAEPYLRQLVVGIGGLGEVTKRQGSKDSEVVTRKAYQFALQQYSKALRGMQTAIRLKRHDLRNALIACLLVFCFESLQGDCRAAAQHARRGLDLLHQWILERFDANPDPKAPIREQEIRGTYFGIDEDIVKAFGALDVQIFYFFLSPGTDIAPTRYVANDTILKTYLEMLPEIFETLVQARKGMALIQARNYRFNIAAFDALARCSRQSWGLVCLDDTLGGPAASVLEETTASWRAAMESYREDIRYWSRASTNLFARLEEMGSQQEKAVAKLLQIQAHHDHIWLEGSFIRSLLDYDAFLPEFTAIVDLCEQVYPFLVASTGLLDRRPDQDPDAKPRLVDGGLFNFDIGVINGLAIVAFRCRNVAIRNRAITLLNRSSYREGIWDSQATGFVADWLRKVEEEGMDKDGFIPEDRRATVTACDVDVKGKTATLGCKIRGHNGKGEDRMEKLEWSFGSGACRMACAPYLLERVL